MRAVRPRRALPAGKTALRPFHRDLHRLFEPRGLLGRNNGLRSVDTHVCDARVGIAPLIELQTAKPRVSTAVHRSIPSLTLAANWASRHLSRIEPRALVSA